jgi:hypothetical protein
MRRPTASIPTLGRTGHNGLTEVEGVDIRPVDLADLSSTESLHG